MNTAPLKFEFALQFPNGTYYTGRANSDDKPDYWQSAHKRDAFTFTEKGAYVKRDSLGCFASCTVVRLLTIGGV